MGQPKKSFEDRINESEEFVKAGNLKSAISTLVKAKRDDPTKAKAIDLGKSIEGLQNRMDVEPPVTDEKPEEKSIEKPEENLNELNDKLGEEKIEKVEDELKEEPKPIDPPVEEKPKEKKPEEKPEEKPATDDLDPDEIIDFRVLRPFIMNKELQVTDKIVELPRRRKNFDYVIALEDE